MTLHHRLSTATPDQQRELIEELFVALNPQPEKKMSGDGIVWLLDDMAFRAMLDCGAYLDAVMSMVPEEWQEWHVGRSWKTSKGQCYALDPVTMHQPIFVHAETIPLALASAVAAAKGV